MVILPLKRGDHPKFFGDDVMNRYHGDEDRIHGLMIKLHSHLKDLFEKLLRTKGDSKNLLMKLIGQLMNDHACLFC